MLNELRMTLPGLREAFARGLNLRELVAEVFRRIEAYDDPALFIHLRDRRDVEAEAARIATMPKDLPLWGVPFAVKDNIDVGGLPTTAGCPAYAYTPEQDAFVTACLRKAGALLIGKTNLDQFATGLVGVRSPYGAPRNAIDPTLVPGGSSSGSAVSVAAGSVAFSLGTDTAGSGRVPAAFNGIVGLKPSLGALSASGVVPACRSLDTVSVFASSIGDAYEVFRTCAVYDRSDCYAKPFRPAPLTRVSNLRIGIPSAETVQFLGDPQQEQMFHAAIVRLAGAGHRLVPIGFQPFFDVAAMLYQGAWVAERLIVIEKLLAGKPEAVHPVTSQIIGTARGLSAADAFRGFYRLQHLRRQAEELMADVDLLCVPSVPTLYSLADLEADPITPNANLGTYTNFVNLMDLCGIAVPAGKRADGKPGSVTILGRSGSDGLCASLARVFET